MGWEIIARIGRLRIGRKSKLKTVDEAWLHDAVKEELGNYVSREELRGYLDNIERDKKKKELWDSLPARKKIKVLRYALQKKGVQCAKK